MSDKFELIKTKLLVFIMLEFVLLILISLFFNDYLIAIQYLFLLMNAVLVIYMFWRMNEARKSRVLSVSQILGNRAKDAFDFGHIGMITLDDAQMITWMSEMFDPYESIHIGDSLHEVLEPLVPLVKGLEQDVRIHIGDDIYKVSTMDNKSILYFQNINRIDELETLNKDNQLVLGIAHLDNYDETTSYEEEQTVAFIDANIRQAVVNWADNHQMFVRRIRQDRYLLVLNEKSFEDIVKQRFSILHDIRKEATKIDASITLSLAFARQTTNFKELEDMSNKALELCQSRGGDQVAINTKGQAMRYYGGNTEAVEKRSKVRVRVMAQNLADLISNASNVLIVGHKDLDFDAFGSAMGVSSIASVYQNNVSIVMNMEDVEASLLRSIKEHETELKKDHKFISLSQAKAIINPSTLLIMVDHHSEAQTQFPELLKLVGDIAVVDHHRRSGDFTFKPKLTYIESSASSGSELIIELFPYHRRNVVISRTQATFMYTGMLVDTNHFRNRSGSRTFEAAAELRKFGADLELADTMLKTDYEDFELKNKVLNQCTVFNEDYVIAAYKDSDIPRTLLSQVADEILSVRNVEASFVIAYVESDVVAVSARSKGDLNVQSIMERMGGGGHFTGAAVQIRGQSINEVVNTLKEVIITVKEES